MSPLYNSPAYKLAANAQRTKQKTGRSAQQSTGQSTGGSNPYQKEIASTSINDRTLNLDFQLMRIEEEDCNKNNK